MKRSLNILLSVDSLIDLSSAVQFRVNQTGCPAGWATDQVLNYDSEPLSCNMPVGGFAALACFIMIMRLFVAVQHSFAWTKRQANERNKRALEGRLPIVPFISWLMLLVYSTFYILVGLNIANARNGAAPFLYGIGFLLFAICSVLYLKKFVSLGYRIAPKTNASTIKAIAGSEKLSRFDTKGKISLFFCLIAIAVQGVLFLVVPFYYVDDDRFIRAAYGVQGYFLVQHAISITIHFERVKSVIRASRNANASNAEDRVTKELDIVVSKLSHQEYVLLICTAISLTFHIVVASDGLPLYWFVPFIFMAIEAINFTLIALTDLLRKKRPTKSSQVKQTDSNDLQGSLSDKAGSSALQLAPSTISQIKS